MKHCAILTMDCLDDFEAYDHLLDQPLLALGWKTQLVSWKQEQINWNEFDVVLIRTPWDYQEDAPRFLQVLNDIEASSAILENNIDIVRWNINKKYLQELQQKQVTIVPTIWQETFNFNDVASYFTKFCTDQIVIKPCVSANADNTFWLTKTNVASHKEQLEIAFTNRDFMAQPFMQSVIEEGEFSCFYFDGKYSHCILKTPKENDFRVQEEFGSRLQLVEPEAKLIMQAEHAIAQLSTTPMYARVDFVRHGNEFAMMEAELIEPSLYFNMDEKSVPLFAKLFVERMQREHQL
ncbi:hypothetical protein RGQ13_06650 [Thalassotalea psychrophila]|uniref:Prokaryotic glutathione synthetase ATP-binding domain-containing protein n=1 Tax=Thalassotalea psychrophila TaxID=3065647 RepID=A0ABY9TXY6_9GAMM|nr:hypothetical protein RGQ13_06650 [Colwelliaceae bacterium SQ149]